MTAFSYVGSELDLFARALRWKSYWRSAIDPLLRGRVLEVGAGNGNNTLFLQGEKAFEWVCLEPDAGLCEELRKRVGQNRQIKVVTGVVADLPSKQTFDTILYIDVLEHIEQDAAELRLAARRLRAGGHLVVLSPAHQWLFTPFDAAIGHFRRYTAESLAEIGPEMLMLASMRYLDSVGMLASLANRVALKQSYPTAAQLAVWDRYMVPASRVLDPILRHKVGKSVLGVWRR